MEEIIAVGIDCALNKHQYQISSRIGVLAKGIIQNSKKDAKKLLKLIINHSKNINVIIGMEATNTYHIPLQKFLQENNYEVIIINPIKTSIYNKIENYGNKTDAIDANTIVQFLLDNKYKNCKQMNQKYLKLREMCRVLLMLQSDLTRVKTRLHTRLAIINPEYSDYFSNDFCKSHIWLLEDYLLPEKIAMLDEEELQNHLNKISNGLGKKKTAKNIIELAKNSFGITENIEGYEFYVKLFLENLKFLIEKIKLLKIQIEEETQKKYCKFEIDIISSIPGISRVLAAGILSEIGDINNFQKKSALIKFAGLIILQKQSGNFTGKTKMSRQGSSQLRCYLFQAGMGVRLHSASFAAAFANRNLKLNGLDTEARRIGKKKVMANIARRVLETIYISLKKKRYFNDKIAFDSLDLEPFVRDTIATSFKEKLAKTE